MVFLYKLKYFPFKTILLFLIFGFTLTHHGRAQTPDHFKKVDQVVWVVEDLEPVINHWKNLGFNNIINYGNTKAKFSNKKGNADINMAIANLGGLHVTLIAPQNGEILFSDFLHDYGEGIMSIVHRMDDKPAMKKEISRLEDSGVEVLEKTTITTPKGDFPYVFMATREKGKYTLGYTYGNSAQAIEELSSSNVYDLNFSQYAFAIQSIEPASSYWEKVGLPAFRVTQGSVREKRYYGKPADFALKQGWQNHARITYEWCIPLQSPNVYEDHMEKHGQGFHHLGFNAKNYDKVMEIYKSKGYKVSMSGAWGEKGKPGSGRFAYIDLEDAGGVAMELLWHYTGE